MAEMIGRAGRMQYIDARSLARGGHAPWKLPRKLKKRIKGSFVADLERCRLAHNSPNHRFRIHYVPLIGWTLTATKKV